MERIILIETSTALCSVALAEDGAVVAYRESSSPKAHASLTAVFIQEMLSERGLTIADCDAVCVSMGPGSYTGLRVGVSTAKGLCFGAGKPLLAVGTLDTLVAQAKIPEIPGQAEIPGHHVIPDLIGDPRFIIPMIDARRMEVYTAVFASPSLNASAIIPSEVEESHTYRQITETAPVIIDESSFAEYLEQGTCLFIGDGAGKCADVIKHPNAHFCQCWPKASSMLEPALAAYRAGDFKDVAYFEPFYLKEFVATVSKKKLF
jgi:tRNA threonylcarbamoyladenosine biosynthesis protein TsaB